MGMNSLNDIWDKVIEILSNQLTPTAINTWFSDCTPVDIEDCRLVLHTTTEFKRNIINSRFSESIKAVLSDIFACDFDLLVLAGDEVNDFELKKKSENSLPEMDGYTFDNFIVGSSNKFAHAAAIAVAENPGKAYNPLFIYGNSGLGKTHLLLAIGQEIHSRSPEKSIAYIKGDEFTNQMVKSLRENKAEEFRTKYRNVSLFLVDDIQFIAGKQGTQEEFFHTFNNIYEAGNQIVITSDRPPMEMAQLDDRLRTRFEWGLMADIQPPDLETRMAITRNKAAQLGLILSDDAVEYIATNITSNIRQLEGVIKRLTAYKEILDDVITIDSVKRAIKDVIRIGTYTPTPDIIIRETARYYSLKEEDLRGQNRSKNMTMARQVSMYLMRSLTGLSLKDIGTHYEDRNHATVLSSIRKVEQLLKNDPSMAGTVRDITSNINSV
ncbi:MAG: chromosomal replication initiator protein DnaA [Oscillospiraceae bacterium]|jgi:chromosomal replication initiator protein|uniref:chromosomal replication initiator protein DnaA n=1 Tax=Candidatus Limivicinus sp. TaxID=3030905 RepID=UPI002A8823A5|nr:chromosomal replication initiator protein DnaA [Clostridiales bacterium]MDY4224515.1 chromosomal replication initiator protein DnaA [Candidatus Limivicinus sp.]MDY5082760.1 chromosomal replication initiator protein DnaA [Candidatus Limivicinus sp.]MED9994238.1 chromosomal replication initiator protein DnaA [Oscillospiraceae bacterium]